MKIVVEFPDEETARAALWAIKAEINRTAPWWAEEAVKRERLWGVAAAAIEEALA